MKKAITVIFTFITLISCFSDNKTHVNSMEIKTTESRVKEVQKYFNLRGNTLDVEFDIFDVNLYSSRVSVPGPTSRDYKVAILTDPEGLKLWTQDVELASASIDIQWAMDLVKENPNFKIDEEPISYFSKNKEVIIFSNSNAVFVRIQQN